MTTASGRPLFAVTLTFPASMLAWLVVFAVESPGAGLLTLLGAAALLGQLARSWYLLTGLLLTLPFMAAMMSPLMEDVSGQNWLVLVLPFFALPMWLMLVAVAAVSGQLRLRWPAPTRRRAPAAAPHQS